MPKIKLIRKIVEEGDGAEKLAPQAKVIYDAMLKHGVGKEVDRETLVKDIEAGGKLTTRQDPGRVVSYYMQQTFSKLGIAETIPDPKVEKPAKAAKDAKGDGATKGGSPAEAGEKKPAKGAHKGEGAHKDAAAA